MAENTIVVYTSDQGFFLGDHGWFDKRLMYEQSLGVPLVIRWPAEITAGTRCEAMISNVGFAATFLDMCGLDPDVALPHQQGRSFRVLLRGTDVPDWPSAVYYRYWEHDDPEHHAPAHYGVGSEDFKYIVYYNDGLGTPGSSERVLPTEYELFDLRRDPAELHNVVDDPDYAAVRLELEAELGRLQDKYADQPYQGPQTPRLHWST